MEINGTPVGRALLAGHVRIGAFRARVLVAPGPVQRELAPGAFQLWVCRPGARPLRIGSWGWIERGDVTPLRAAFGETMERSIAVLDPDVERVRRDVLARLVDLEERAAAVRAADDPALRAALEQTLYVNGSGKA